MVAVTFLLLALVTLVLGQDESVSSCSSIDAASLKVALRRSACKLAPGGNETAANAFQENVRDKHGGGDWPYFALANFFSFQTSSVWCRTTCVSPAPALENITWCINIPFQDRDVETCMRVGSDGVVVTNSTCEAELAEIPKSLSFPDNCGFYGKGCLGLTYLDWFFEAAYLTCTVDTGTCHSKSFISLLVQSQILQPPEFEVFPSAPVHALTSDSIVVHMEVSTTTERIAAAWHFGDIAYNRFIFGDPFCNNGIEQCQNDSHPGAADLMKNRIRIYRTTRIFTLDGCQSATLYRLESYLIIDNVTEMDNGEYTFNVTVTTSGYSSITDTRSVNITSGCYPIPREVKCSQGLLSVDKGQSATWECQMISSPGNDFALIFNKSEVVLPSKPGEKCGDKSRLMFVVHEERVHVCYSKFNVTVTICSATYDVIGKFSIVNSTGVDMTKPDSRPGELHIAGTGFEVKLIEEPPITSPSEGDVKSPILYAAPLAALAAVSIALLAVLVMALRLRKRKRRVITRVQSPSLKEMSFLKEEADHGLHSPTSPGTSLLDPLEFPRNRLYIYSNKLLGEGSFGRVLQAKAEGIVPGMPERNVVAVKTTKEAATSVEKEELLAELQLMRAMEPHENILNLLGQCTTGGGPVCLIVEFATYGNLRDFLRQCEEVVLSLNHLPHIPRNRSRTRTFSTSSCSSAQPLITRQDSVFTPSSGHTHFVFPSPTGHVSSGSSGSSGDVKLTAHHPETAAVPLAHSVAPIGHDYINTKGLVYMEDVHNFALQIACGLEHLANMQVVHCDLAARNVLIAEGFVLKIADFGLARDISGREMYKKNPRGKIPVKWTAPEALEKRIFTVKSDVWSYGVLLWELFNYGHTPYPDVNIGHSYEAFISYLNDGHRMQQPENCPDTFYQLMLGCWDMDPSLRPTPHDIVTKLTPSAGVYDDADSELNDGTHSTSKTSTPGTAGHQSSQE